MKARLNKVFLLFTAAVFLFSACATTPDAGDYDLQESTEPEPYGEDEFPQWMQGVRRAEVLFAGSLPFTFILSNMGYSAYRMARNGFTGSDSLSVTGSGLTDEEKKGILIATISVSGAVALADFILGFFED